MFPRGELRHREGTDSGESIQPELGGPGSRASWPDGCLPCPLHSGPSHSWEDPGRVEFERRPWVGLGPEFRSLDSASPGLSSWENNFSLYLAMK